MHARTIHGTHVGIRGQLAEVCVPLPTCWTQRLTQLASFERKQLHSLSHLANQKYFNIHCG